MNSAKRAKIFSVVNQKGGVGKTTTTVNLAAVFASLKKRVLLIDLDPQGNASTGYGISLSQRQKTIYEVLIGECDIKQALIPTKFPNLKIITSTVDLSACEVELVELRVQPRPGMAAGPLETGDGDRQRGRGLS